MTAFYVGALGIAGVLARFAIGSLVSRWYPAPFPAATFAINVTGSFLIGIVYSLGAERGLIPPAIRVGLMVGFLGGYTTFSSYSLETIRLVEARSYATALAYLILSPALGLAAVAAGLALARAWGAR